MPSVATRGADPREGPLGRYQGLAPLRARGEPRRSRRVPFRTRCRASGRAPCRASCATRVARSVTGLLRAIRRCRSFTAPDARPEGSAAVRVPCGTDRSFSAPSSTLSVGLRASPVSRVVRPSGARPSGRSTDPVGVGDVYSRSPRLRKGLRQTFPPRIPLRGNGFRPVDELVHNLGERCGEDGLSLCTASAQLSPTCGSARAATPDAVTVMGHSSITDSWGDRTLRRSLALSAAPHRVGA